MQEGDFAFYPKMIQGFTGKSALTGTTALYVIETGCTLFLKDISLIILLAIIGRLHEKKR